jgi:hypothetical protein
VTTGSKWWIFRWADPLFGIKGGPRYYGISWRGLQVGYWESAARYHKRLPIGEDQSLPLIAHLADDRRLAFKSRDSSA